MAFKLRILNAKAKFPNEVNIQAIHKVVSRADVENALEKTGKRELRLNKLSAAFVIWFCIALNLYTSEAYKDVLSKLVKGLRYIWPDHNLKLVGKSALCQARYRLGVAPMVELFRQTAKPIADLSVPGAYLFGLRLMAIDGTTEDVADSPENAAYFGRHTGSRGDSAFPQAQIVYLSECCTHTICDAGIWPLYTNERKGAHRMLRSVHPGMLVTMDRGIICYEMARWVCERGAHFLARVGAHWKLKPVQFLKDGSYLTYIYPTDYQRKKSR